MFKENNNNNNNQAINERGLRRSIDIPEMHSVLEDQVHQNDEAMYYEPSEPQLHGPTSGGKYTCEEGSK